MALFPLVALLVAVVGPAPSGLAQHPRPGGPGPREVVALRFAWPAAVGAKVTCRRERRLDGRSPIEATFTWKQRAVLKDGRHRLTVSGSRLLGGDGDLASAPKALFGIQESLHTVVSAQGAFVEVEGVEEARAALERVAREDERLPKLDPKVLGLVAEVARNEALQRWQAEVGAWNGLDLEVGATYQTEQATAAPGPGGANGASGKVTLVDRVPCAPGLTAPRCVALVLETTVGGPELEAATGAFLARLVGTDMAMAKEGAGFVALVTRVSLLTEPDRLLPHRVEIVKTLQVKADGQASGAGLQTGVDRTVYEYEYGTPSAPVGQAGRALGRLGEDCSRGDSEACLLAGLVLLGGEAGPRSSAQAAPLLERACAAGHGLACSKLGELHAHGDGVPMDPSRGVGLHEQACTAGEPSSCERAGVAFLEGRGVARDAARAAGLFGRALRGYQAECASGSALSCTLAGFLLGDQLSSTPDAGARKAEFFRMGCDGGDALACGRYARELWMGRSVPQDMPKALLLDRKACDGGVASACSSVGVAYHAGEGVERDAAQAARYCGLGCDGDDARGCACLAEHLERGAGVPLDEGRAIGLYGRACQLDGSTGCVRAGAALVAGKVVPRDEQAGAALLEKGCQAGDGDGCARLSSLARDGRGVEQDLARAARLAATACELGSQRGCGTLGTLLLVGRGVPRDQARGAGLLEAACRASDRTSCTWLGWARFRGLGVPVDPDLGREAYQRACDAREEWACGALKRLPTVIDPAMPGNTRSR